MEWEYVQIKNVEPKYKNRFNRLKRRARALLIVMPKWQLLLYLKNYLLQSQKPLNKVYRRCVYMESISSNATVTVLPWSFTVSFT